MKTTTTKPQTNPRLCYAMVDNSYLLLTCPCCCSPSLGIGRDCGNHGVCRRSASEGEAACVTGISEADVVTGALGGGGDITVEGGGVTGRSTSTEATIVTPKSKLLLQS
jgi:hypothetical protein